MQFMLLAAAVLALSHVQVQARPLTRSVTYLTYATDLYVDPWVVMQGQRAASTVSETALVATDALPSSATDATGSTTALSSPTTDAATQATGSALAVAPALPSSLTADSASSTETASSSEEPASSTEEEQSYSIQTQS